MILKASQRGGGQDLAVHLMRLDDNEHISLHELRGFASDNLKDAFRESEAISHGTKCRQHLFSLSLSPPQEARVPNEVFEKAISTIEEKLGLEGQPRAVVFHEKEGRRHAHCVWSRIDADTMTAKQLSFFKTKLMGVSRELYLENGWKLPEGLKSPSERNPTNFSLAEWQQAKRQGVDPRWLKQTVQESWKHSDGLRAFSKAVEENGLFLAKGDKRGFVVVDHHGDVYSLPRLLDQKTKDVRARLGAGDDLPSVAATKEIIGQKMTPAIRRHIAESRTQFQGKQTELTTRKAEMTIQHRQERHELGDRQRSEWDSENRVRAARLPKGLRGLWHRITGKYQAVHSQNETEATATQHRHAQERQHVIDRQLTQRGKLQSEIRELRHDQAVRLADLRKDVGRFFRFSSSHSSRERTREISVGLKLDR